MISNPILSIPLSRDNPGGNSVGQSKLHAGDDWQSFFESCGCPLSLSYLSPNLTPLHSLEIHNHEMGIPTGIAPAYLDPICLRWTSLSAHNLMLFLQNSIEVSSLSTPIALICDFPSLEPLESLIKQASEGSVAAEHTWKEKCPQNPS